jgi:exodeoxyribonuclease VII large subunit
MTWDLFAAAEAAQRDADAEARRTSSPRRSGARRGAASAPPPDGRPGGLEFNESLARRVAAGAVEMDSGLTDRQAEWPVSRVNALARELIEGALPPLWVAGEVTNFTRARSGHCYFSLRDEWAQLRCVMWRDEARRLPTAPEEGMHVRALGHLTLYEARGEFQLVVSVLEGRGEGLWKLAFERLRARLDGEGLTAPERKRPLPRVPAAVGVVTSVDGAALRDVVSVIRRRAPWTRIVLASCRVQGDGSAAEIAAALERIGRSGMVDVVIVGRGGGSVEDLWAFNEESVARAIAASPVPVISAVGHETDFTIADLVADLRAPTPSAAAEAAVADGVALRGRLDELRRCLAAAARECVASARDTLDVAAERLRSGASRSLQARQDRVRGAATQLQALSPLATLARGYAVPLAADGRVLRRSRDFQPGLPFRLRLADGEVACRADGAAGDAQQDG